jgi:hypothetical protein
MYTIGPYKVNKHALDLDQWGIQCGTLALDGLSIFGDCIDHDCSCAISSKAIGYFY